MNGSNGLKDNEVKSKTKHPPDEARYVQGMWLPAQPVKTRRSSDSLLSMQLREKMGIEVKEKQK